MHRIAVAALVGLVSIAGCKELDEPAAPPATAAPAPTPSTPEPPKSQRPSLQRTQPLPKMARRLLTQRMIDHGDDMEQLQWSALMLDHESIIAITAHMASGPTLSKPRPGSEDTLNAMLPAEFFTLQEELENSMTLLANGARAKDNLAVADGYGTMVKTCIHCHNLYLDMPIPEEQ